MQHTYRLFDSQIYGLSAQRRGQQCRQCCQQKFHKSTTTLPQFSLSTVPYWTALDIELGNLAKRQTVHSKRKSTVAHAMRAQGRKDTAQRFARSSETACHVVLRAPERLPNSVAREIRTVKNVDLLQRIVIVLPPETLREQFRLRLARELGGMANVEIVTLARLANLLRPTDTQQKTRDFLTPWAEHAIIAHAARKTSGYFAPIANTPGFTQEAASLFSDLRQARINPDALRRAAVTLETRRKLASLAPLYERVDKTCPTLSSPDDIFEHADITELTNVPLFLYGFTPTTKVQLRFLSRALTVTTLQVFLPFTATKADDALHEARVWLESLGAEWPETPQLAISRMTTRTKERSSAQQLRTHIFSEENDTDTKKPAKPIPIDNSTVFVQAADVLQETREAARACLRWAGAGVSFSDMMVVFPPRKGHSALLRETFSQAGIPLWLHDTDPVAHSALGRQSLQLASLAGSTFPREDLMVFLSETDFPPATLEKFPMTQVWRWEGLAQRAGIESGSEEWSTRLGRMTPKTNSKLDAALGKAEQAALRELQNFLEQFIPDLGSPPSRALWHEHLSWFGKRLTRYVHRADEIVEILESVGRAARTANKETEKITWADFSASLPVILDVVPQPTTKKPENAVRAGDLSQAAFANIRTLAILGLAEGWIPLAMPHMPLLTDRERHQIAQSLSIQFPPRAPSLPSQQQKFVLALHAAGEHLHLSRPLTDRKTGRSLPPSPFYNAARIAACAGQTLQDATEFAPETNAPLDTISPATPNACLNGNELLRHLLVQNPSETLPALARRHPQVASARLSWAKRWLSPHLTEYDGMVGPEAVQSLSLKHPLRQPLSATRLETYAACPYRFFLAHILGIKEKNVERACHDLSNRDKGTLIHEILEKFMRANKGEPLTPETRKERLSLLHRTATQVFSEWEERKETGHPLLWEQTKRALLTDLERWHDIETASYDATWKPIAFEVGFGKTQKETGEDPLSSDAPLTISNGEYRMRFTGRIDRIDISTCEETPTRFRVTDYKTGTHNPLHRNNAISGGRALQLPVYLHAAANLLGHKVEEGEGEYVHTTRKGSFTKIRCEGAPLTVLSNPFIQVITQLVHHLSRGDFHPVPHPHGHCSHCDFLDICDIRKEHLFARKAHDPDVRNFARLAQFDRLVNPEAAPTASHSIEKNMSRNNG